MVNLSAQLEKWKGAFGRAYTDRNIFSPSELDKLYKNKFGITRGQLNRLFLSRMNRSSRILEVGANVGNQLAYLQKTGFKNLYGIEPQSYARKFSKARLKGVVIDQADAFKIPFKDNFFDLVFTSGVLVHISPKDVKKAIKEIYRCSRKYIWGLESYSPRCREVLYRGKRGLYWKADFVKLYSDMFEGLKLVRKVNLKYLDSGNVDTMFLFKKGGK